MIENQRKRPAVFYGWWIVIASTLIMMNTSGVLNFGFTAAFDPIVAEFGWSYAQVSFGASLRGLETGLLVPLVGFLVDRWGTRRLVFIGSIIVMLGLLLLSQVNSLGMYYAAFILISVGMSTCVGTVFLPTVANWFRRRLGTAIGAVSAGVGFGGLLVLPITMLIDALSWRTAMIYLAIWYVGLNIPIALIIRHRPEQYGYLPDGDVQPPVINEAAAAPEDIGTVVPARQVFRHSVYWRLALASTCYAMVSGAVATHIMPCLATINISRSVSSMIALVMPLVSVVGRFGAGWLGDRFDRKRVYIACFVLMAIGSLLFAFITRGMLWLMVPFIIFFSLGWGGTITGRPALLKQYYEKTRYGTILGVADGAMMFGQVIGIPLAGWVFDTWGSYQYAWLGSVVVTLIGMLLVWSTSQPVVSEGRIIR